MKLLEKLAREFLLENGRSGGSSLKTLAAYEAGFRKAREMAYELLKENSDKRIFSMDIDIENLGEKTLTEAED